MKYQRLGVKMAGVFALAALLAGAQASWGETAKSPVAKFRTRFPARPAAGANVTTASLSAKTSAPAASSPRERWGVEVVALRRTAAGSLLDFRCRVLDPAKAAPIFDKKKKPYVIDQKSGARFIVPEPPKVGQLRVTDKSAIEAGKIYFVLFANPGGYIKKGARATVVIGDFRAEDLVVQ